MFGSTHKFNKQNLWNEFGSNRTGISKIDQKISSNPGQERQTKYKEANKK